jgi:hypothetical protein
MKRPCREVKANKTSGQASVRNAAFWARARRPPNANAAVRSTLSATP